MWDIWKSGSFVGNDKPVTRAVIQKTVLEKYGPWRSLNFGQSEPWYEIPNIKNVQIDQRLGTDAASMTLTMLNQVDIDPTKNLDLTHAGDDPATQSATAEGQPVGPTVRELKDLGEPGYYSYRHGVTPESSPRWGHSIDSIWVDMFIPNRVIRTFQGYGTDNAIQPWDDTKLIHTGTWLIDRVEYSTDGLITIECRDAAKLLIEQRLYPPIIPVAQYPLDICADEIETSTESVEVVEEEEVPGAVGVNVAQHISSGWDSSVAPWYGYNGSVYGHRASHAFDGDTSSYWLSVGNSGPNEVWSYEWIGADCNGEPINQVHFKPKWGGYVCYVAVKEDGKWQGSDIVPYGSTSEPAYPNGSNKPYVKKVNIPKSEAWFDIDLPRFYNAEQVWLIFTNLQYSGLGNYPYRAAVYEMQVRAATAPVEEVVTEEEVTTETLIPGNIRDYTDIVKVFAGWSGFYWPDGPTDQLIEEWTKDSGVFTTGTVEIGRIWGDFAYSGAYPVEPPCIPKSFWDNKSVMDGINQIKEILGFICYIDATGGIVWRMPNIWSTGNFISGVGYIEDSIRTVDEVEVLVDFGVSVDDASLRSEIHVVSAEDRTLHTSIIPRWASGETIDHPVAVDPRGDLALLGGQERILLVPNYPFISQEEVDKFAYLISLWIHWSYRKSRFRIPGNPAFEPDDQIRIYERVSSEAYIHYIQGVSSTMDLDAGTWNLEIDTHWLGNGPDQTWHVQTYNDMPPALYAYLVSIRAIDESGDPADLPEGFDPDYEYPDFPDEYPRVEDDYSQLFPSLATINYPYDDSWSDLDIALDIGSDYVVDPSPGDGGTVNHRSEAWKSAYWGSRCANQTTKTFMVEWNTKYATAGGPANTHSGQLKTVRSTFHRDAAKAFLLMGEIFANHGYYVYSAGAYNCRYISGTNVWSSHAWGLAIDINPDVNGCCSIPWSTWYARPTSPTFYAAAKDITQRIKTVNGSRVFGWGGYWSSKKDYMHFEVVAARSDVLDGVVIV